MRLQTPESRLTRKVKIMGTLRHYVIGDLVIDEVQAIQDGQLSRVLSNPQAEAKRRLEGMKGVGGRAPRSAFKGGNAAPVMPSDLGVHRRVKAPADGGIGAVIRRMRARKELFR